MFDNLSQKLQEIIAKTRGQAQLSEENMQEALREIRRALLGADVSLNSFTADTQNAQVLVLSYKDGYMNDSYVTQLSLTHGFSTVNAELDTTDCDYIKCFVITNDGRIKLLAESKMLPLE